MFKVIVNADDLGASVQVNKAIEDCIEKGYISSATIMAGGKALLDAARIANSYSGVSFGVHLTLDEYDSISHSPVLQKYGLTDTEGRFLKNGYKKVECYTDELKVAVRDEWDAQIKKIRECGVKISHADSHHHCHTYPVLSDVLREVLDQNEISKVRIPQTRTCSMRLHGISRPSVKTSKESMSSIPLKKSSWLKAILGSWKDSIRLRWYKKHFMTTDFFCSASFMQMHKTFLIEYYPNYTIEIMCHPGHPDYENETMGLKGMCNGCTMINYNQL